MTVLSPPGYVKQILERLINAGHTAYCVGGCVRDAIMGRPVRDWDVATSALPEDVAKLFPKTALTGERFGTVTVIQAEGLVEVTTYRTEGNYNDARHPESVSFLGNLEDDLRRRDFTINAMASSIAGEIRDMFGGCKDIENRIIRCVGDPRVRFGEDALRMFRAFRFRAELDFEIERVTLSAIAECASAAGNISAERVRAELAMTLMSKKPEIAGEMIEAGLLDRYLAKLPARLQIKTCQRAKCVMVPVPLTHFLARIARLPSEPALRWSAFCAVLHDAGLIASPAEFLRSLKLDGRTIRACSIKSSIWDGRGDTTGAIQMQARNETPENIGIKHMLAKHGILATRCAAAARDVAQADTMADPHGSGEIAGFYPSDPQQWREQAPALRCFDLVDEVIASGDCWSLKGLSVDGKDLIACGYPPGIELGKTLNALLDRVIEHPEDNDRDTLLKLANRIIML